MTNVAQSSNWANEGVRLIQAKQQAAASDTQYAQAANAAFFAYQSLPIDINADGTYRLDFGPVVSSFQFPVSPSGFTTELPPDCFSYFSPSLGLARIVTINGERYLEVSLTITGLAQAYQQFTAWVS